MGTCSHPATCTGTRGHQSNMRQLIRDSPPLSRVLRTLAACMRRIPVWSPLKASEGAGMTANQMQDRQCGKCHTPRLSSETAALGSPVASESTGQLCITSWPQMCAAGRPCSHTWHSRLTCGGCHPLCPPSSHPAACCSTPRLFSHSQHW